jgi:hypothetical protein
MDINFEYKGIKVSVEMPGYITKATFDIDFLGQYLIEFKWNGTSVIPTGNAMDGGGNQHTVELDELVIKYIKW